MTTSGEVKKPEVFVRKASGLVRTAGVWDVLAYNVNFTSIGLLLAFLIMLGPAFYPGNNMAWSTVFCTLLLTALAWHATGRGLRLEPLPPSVVADFLRTVASRRTAAPDAPERALDAWIAELAEQRRLDARESALTRAFGRGCLERLAAECGSIDPGIPVDGRYVSCLLLEPRGLSASMR